MKNTDQANPIDKTRKSAVEWFNDQIVELKPQLPKNYKMDLLALLPKEYDTAGGGRVIDNVMNLRTTDMAVLEALKELVKQIRK